MIKKRSTHKLLEHAVTHHNAGPTDNSNPILYMKYKDGKASGRQISKNEFVIFKGSIINPTIGKCCRPHVLAARKANVNKIKGGKLSADIIFKGPNIAACFISGSSTSGNRYWRDINGIKLKDLKNQ